MESDSRTLHQRHVFENGTHGIRMPAPAFLRAEIQAREVHDVTERESIGLVATADERLLQRMLVLLVVDGRSQ